MRFNQFLDDCDMCLRPESESATESRSRSKACVNAVCRMKIRPRLSLLADGYDRKISSWMFCRNACAIISILISESQETRDLQAFLVIDCNRQMKFFAAHCGRR
jgi:hypothetical protein